MGKMLLVDEPSPEDVETLQRLRIELITSNKPGNYRPNDPDNVIIQFDKSFAALMSLAESNGAHNPGEMTCFDFYARIDFLRRKHSKNK